MACTTGRKSVDMTVVQAMTVRYPCRSCRPASPPILCLLLQHRPWSPKAPEVRRLTMRGHLLSYHPLPRVSLPCRPLPPASRTTSGAQRITWLSFPSPRSCALKPLKYIPHHRDADIEQRGGPGVPFLLWTLAALTYGWHSDRPRMVAGYNGMADGPDSTAPHYCRELPQTHETTPMPRQPPAPRIHLVRRWQLEVPCSSRFRSP